jgi:hypothetical protein
MGRVRASKSGHWATAHCLRAGRVTDNCDGRVGRMIGIRAHSGLVALHPRRKQQTAETAAKPPSPDSPPPPVARFVKSSLNWPTGLERLE